VLGLPEAVHACLFDLDGVLTDTASVHTKAWKAMFDAFLEQRAEQSGQPFVPFDIELPDGDPDDGGDKDTIYGLGTRKNDAFQETLEKDGVEVFEGSRRYLEKVTAAGLATAVVSSSANTRQVLEITGLDKFIQQRVDGVTLREEHIAGKPAPDSYLHAAELLNVEPSAAAVFEDALSGVESGRAGNFFVVGVDRVGQADELRSHGADVVVKDLGELL
jgi:beta-phosphoglucomutase family hydrolase